MPRLLAVSCPPSLHRVLAIAICAARGAVGAMELPGTDPWRGARIGIRGPPLGAHRDPSGKWSRGHPLNSGTGTLKPAPATPQGTGQHARWRRWRPPPHPPASPRASRRGCRAPRLAYPPPLARPTRRYSARQALRLAHRPQGRVAAPQAGAHSPQGRRYRRGDGLAGLGVGNTGGGGGRAGLGPAGTAAQDARGEGARSAAECAGRAGGHGVGVCCARKGAVHILGMPTTDARIALPAGLPASFPALPRARLPVSLPPACTPASLPCGLSASVP
eukprot:scaffold20836_cov106-Isochrysis_galbana.AAC.2